jgi:hypothetical protein
MQTYITAGERKIHDLQVRYDELPNILCEFKAAQSELELLDNFDHSADSHLKNSIIKLEQGLMNCCIQLAHLACQLHHKVGQYMKGVLQAPRMLVLLVSSYLLLHYRLMQATTVSG